jgi:threonine aldolase
VPISGINGKFTPEELSKNIGGVGIVHHTQPSVVSITQLCETGEAYQLDEIAAISETAHKHNLKMHMDGARFANALVSLNATPAEMTWKSGIDVLSFGATKNGCIAAEAIIFFKPDLVGNLPFLMKRSGHLLSKMRFISAQLEAYISNDTWLRNAKHANNMGKILSEGLAKHNSIELAYPTEANEVFAKFPRYMIEHLNSEGYKMNEDELDGKAVRLVAAWNTKTSDVESFLNSINQSN